LAKICFLTDRSPSDPDPFSWLIWNQFRVLTDSQHDVLVITNQAAPDDERWQHPRLQVITPFKSWSLRYLPRFLTLIAHHKPDVLHWIESREKSLTHLQWLTPGLAALPKRPVLAMSLWDPRLWQKNWMVAGTLPTMDLIFVTHPPHRELLWERWPQMMSRVQIAPLLFDLPQTAAEIPSSHWLTNWAQEFEFVPGILSDTIHHEAVVESLYKSLTENPERHAVVPMSNRQDRFTFLEELRDLELDGRVAVFENLDWATWNFLLTNAKEIRGDILSAKSPFLSMAMQWSRARSKPLRLTSEQKNMFSDLQVQDAANFLGRAYQSALR
jgi:hypothetical protein